MDEFTELLTTTEVAQMLRKSPQAVRAMVHEKKGPRSARIGGRRMFRRADVEAWIEAQFAKESA